MPLSTLPYLHYTPLFFGTIFIGFGFLWFIDPAKALSFFELPYPEVPDTKTKGKQQDTSALALAKKTIDVFAIIYGVRDIFMGASLYAAALCGTRQTLGWITLAASVVAATDGWVCYTMVGKGEMNHWGYAPHVAAVGLSLLGALDWVPVDAVIEKVFG